MATQYYDNKEQGKVISVEPATLIKVKVVEIEKTVEVPVFKNVEVDKPVFIKKEYERPIIIDKEYERPVIIDKEYEKPVIVNKEVVVEVPVPVEKPYDKPVPIEVPYDIPVVSMKKVNQIASETAITLGKAKDMLKEINATMKLFYDVIANVKAFNDVVSELNSAIKDAKIKLSEVKNYNIIEEDLIVKVPKMEYETVRVIGKIIAREA